MRAAPKPVQPQLHSLRSGSASRRGSASPGPTRVPSAPFPNPSRQRGSAGTSLQLQEPGPGWQPPSDPAHVRVLVIKAEIPPCTPTFAFPRHDAPSAPAAIRAEAETPPCLLSLFTLQQQLFPAVCVGLSLGNPAEKRLRGPSNAAVQPEELRGAAAAGNSSSPAVIKRMGLG